MAWSHFYGTVKGKKSTGEASRISTREDGLRVVACSKQGAIEVWLGHHHPTGEDTFHINMRRHGSSTGYEGTIVSGVVGVKPDMVTGVLPRPTIESFTDQELMEALAARGYASHKEA